MNPRRVQVETSKRYELVAAALRIEHRGRTSVSRASSCSKDRSLR